MKSKGAFSPVATAAMQMRWAVRLLLLRLSAFADLAQGARIGVSGGNNARNAPWQPEERFEVQFPTRRLPAPSYATAAAAMEAMPPELVRQVLCLLPGQPPVAWSAGGRAAVVSRRGLDEAPTALEEQASVIIGVAFLSGGDRVLTTSVDGENALWDTWSGRKVYELNHHHGKVLDVQVFPDHDKVVTLGTDWQALVWSVATGDIVLRLDISVVADHSRVRVLLGGRRLVTARSSRLSDPAVIWGLPEGDALHRLLQPVQEEIRFLEVPSCGTRVVTAGFYRIFIWSALTGLLEQTLAASPKMFSEIAVSRYATKVAGLTEGGVRVWDGASGDLGPWPALPGEHLTAFGLLAGGRRVVAFSPSGAGAIWDTASGRRLLRLDHSRGRVGRAAVSADGQVVAACGRRRLWRGAGDELALWVSLWDASTGRLLHTSIERKTPTAWKCSIALGPTPSAAEVFRGPRARLAMAPL